MKDRVRLGIWALPLSGLLSTIAALVPGIGIDPTVDPEGFARASSNIGLGNMLGIPSSALLLIGILADGSNDFDLYVYRTTDGQLVGSSTAGGGETQEQVMIQSPT